MLQLPPPLAPLGAYRQFIVVKFVSSWKKPGKMDKIPVSARTGEAIDAHSPAEWVDAPTACSIAASWGSAYGVGFVFTRSDPFWFLDIDNAVTQDGQWSPVAQQLCGLLGGAAMEVSQSRTGLHVFGSFPPGAPWPEHGCKNIPYGLEFYTEGRFVALTGLNAVGDAATQHTEALAWVIPTYFPPRDAGNTGIDWTTGPREDWAGPSDDDELIARMCRVTSTGAMFGAKATIKDLFEGNVEALSKAFPDSGGRAYDASSADAALAQHLAFWTGCDCERIERIMRRSALVRPKWDERDDYLRDRTILGAVRRQEKVYNRAVTEPPPGPAMSSSISTQAPVPTEIKGNTFLDLAGQIEHFRGCVYVSSLHRVLIPGGDLVKPETFNSTYGGRTFVMDTANTKVTKKAFEAFTESQVLIAPRANGICFRPDLAPGVIVHEAGRSRVNTWWPVDVPRKVGDATMFITHLQKLQPDERDRTILLSYLAACVQHPGYKFQWAPLIQGVEGNGKTVLSLCVANAIGARYVHWPRASKLGKQFNGWMVGKLLYCVEDIYTNDQTVDVIEELKPMITGGHGLEIEGKGIDQISTEIVGNFIFNTNHRSGIRKTKNDRRYGNFICPQQSREDLVRDGMDSAYMKRLYDWLKHEDGFAVVTELLMTWPIPDEFNPATFCQRAPHTTATDKAIEDSMGSVEQEIMEAVARGDTGFNGGWISSTFLERLLERLKKQSAVSPRKRVEMLESLGYIRHPGLQDGRVNNTVMPDGNKPRLFIRKDSPLVGLVGAAEIAHSYTRAQGAAFGEVTR